MSSLLGAIGDAAGDSGYNKLVDFSKNLGIQGGINSAIKGYTGIVNENQEALGDYITKYLGDYSKAASNTSQETGAIDQFYNGGMGTQLAGLRAGQQAATDQAANVAGQQAIRAQNGANLSAPGGGSSYATRMLASMLMPIQANAAVTNAGQERSDLGYLSGQQLDLAGRRTGMQTDLSQYGLAPTQVAQNLYSSQLGDLSNLTSLNNANNQFGIQYTPSGWQQAGDIVGSLTGGSGGGGGGTQWLNSIGSGVGSAIGSVGGGVGSMLGGGSGGGGGE